MSAVVADLLRTAEARLAAGGSDTARLDAQLLLAHAMGQSRTALLLHALHEAPVAVCDQFNALVERRARHEPVAYLLGCQEFWSLAFQVTPAVLIPRPDSETLVEEALALTRTQSEGRVLDLGTGSGCLLLSLLSERPGWSGLGVDASAAALEVAQVNARALGLEARTHFRHGDWLAGVEGRFDLLLCNPPYIGEGERALLMPDVADYEPATALFAGADGLAAYRILLPQISRVLTPAGVALFEIGATQGEAVCALARDAGFTPRRVRDLGGRDRVIVCEQEDR